MILNALREATRPLHDRLDNCMPITDPDLTVEGYTDILKSFYGIFGPLEAQLMNMAPWLNTMPDYPERQRMPMLDQDLDALGVSDAERMALPRFEFSHMKALDEGMDLNTVFGVMYVMEGSTLGGQQLVKHLQQHFGWEENQHCDFFNSYGAEVGPRWKQFCTTLEAYAQEQTPDEQATIVEAAVNTFTELERWFTTQKNQHKHPVLTV